MQDVMELKRLVWTTTPGALLGVLMGEVRRARGVKVADLVPVYGLSQSSISRMETGKLSLPFHCVWEFCRTFAVAPADLFAELDEWIERVEAEGVVVRARPPEGARPLPGNEVRQVYLARALPKHLARGKEE
jgi:hypothetical protein